MKNRLIRLWGSGWVPFLLPGTLLLITLVLLSVGGITNKVNAAPPPRAFGAWGNASTTNTAVTSTIGPATICVSNDDAAEPLYVDITDGIATTASGSTNFRVNGGESRCWSWGNLDPAQVTVIGIISAAGTPAYRVEALQR